MILISWIVVLPIMLPIEPIRQFWFDFALDYFPSMVWIGLIIVLQTVLAKFVLLQDPEVDGSIDNRRFYNIMAYFFYFNVSCTRFTGHKLPCSH